MAQFNGNYNTFSFGSWEHNNLHRYPAPGHWARHQDLTERQRQARREEIRERFTRIEREQGAAAYSRQWTEYVTAGLAEAERWTEQFNRAIPYEEPPLNAGWIKKYPELDLSKLPHVPQDRSVSLKPFKLEYENVDELGRRLRRSLISIKGNPYYVWDILNFGTHNEPIWGLMVTDSPTSPVNTKTHSLVRLRDLDDLRSIQPGYIQIRSTACWMSRHPSRTYSQGLTAENMSLHRVGYDQPVDWGWQDLIDGLKKRNKIIWKDGMESVFESGVAQSMRLSNHVAVFRPDEVKNPGIRVAYKGRNLGVIVKDRVRVDNAADLGPSWIAAECESVGLRLEQ